MRADERPAFGTSIKLRILILISLIILPATIILVLLYMRGIEEGLEITAKRISATIVRNLSFWFAQVDFLEKKDIGKQLKSFTDENPEFIVIDIFLKKERDLEIFASSRGDVYISPTPKDYAAFNKGSVEIKRSLLGERAVLDISLPICREKRIIGLVRAVVKDPKNDIWIGAAHSEFLLGMVILMAIVALVLFVYLNLVISIPIKRLLSGMKRAMEGELGVVVPVTTSGEIGWLTLTFNRMLCQISQFNKQLQEKIKNATQELEERNRDLISMNEKLFELQRRLTQAERLASLGQLSTQLAHELGTTLNVISGHVQILRSLNLEEGITQRICLIQNQLDRLTTIIRNVLKTMKLPQPNVERLDINEILQEMLSFISPTLSANNIIYELELGKDIGRVRGDKSQLQQVFMNLITNAIEAMPSGGRLKIETSEILDEHPEGAEKLISIKFIDNGKGISSGDLKRIFEPFFSTKDSLQGSGLGLAISREIIKNHGGQILVQSTPGRGSIFDVRMPSTRDG